MDLFEFRDRFQLGASERVVCIGERAFLAKVLSENEMEKLFGGWIIYSDTNHLDYIGVWGARNARTMRRMLRERGIDVSLTRGRPPAVRMRLRHSLSR